MDKKKRRKELLNKLKKSNRIFDVDYDTLEKDLEENLENEFLKKKDKLTSLLYEKESLRLIIAASNQKLI